MNNESPYTTSTNGNLCQFRWMNMCIWNSIFTPTLQETRSFFKCGLVYVKPVVYPAIVTGTQNEDLSHSKISFLRWLSSWLFPWLDHNQPSPVLSTRRPSFSIYTYISCLSLAAILPLYIPVISLPCAVSFVFPQVAFHISSTKYIRNDIVLPHPY